MPQSGFTGISYPFRISNRGGVVMSTTSRNDPSHIAESIQQIFNTNFLERPMEADIYSNITSLLFEPNDISLQQVLKARIVDDLDRLEKRIECDEDSVEFEVEVEEGIDYLYVYITYKIIKYNTYYTSKIKVGEVSHE